MVKGTYWSYLLSTRSLDSGNYLCLSENDMGKHAVLGGGWTLMGLVTPQLPLFVKVIVEQKKILWSHFSERETEDSLTLVFSAHNVFIFLFFWLLNPDWLSPFSKTKQNRTKIEADLFLVLGNSPVASTYPCPLEDGLLPKGYNDFGPMSLLFTLNT